MLVVGKSMGKQRLFSCQTVDQMVAMPPSSVINPLASAGALTRMVMNLWGLEQMEDVFAEVKVCIYKKHAFISVLKGLHVVTTHFF